MSQIGWKHRDRKRDTMQIVPQRADVIVLMSDKIDFKAKEY